ncbi:MAG TPA: hypothetical protein VMI54_29680 [Polyangiaceae bacterium]|nr:hypothetical protein [Polyangiaceae bacterium]
MLLVFAAGCSKYLFESGPDPASDGEITSCNPPTAIDGECPGLSSCLETSCSTQLKAALDPGAELDATECDDLVRCVIDEEQDACTGTGWTALATCERNHCASCNKSVGPNPSGGSAGSSGGTSGSGDGAGTSSSEGGRASGRGGADENGGSGKNGAGGMVGAAGTLGLGGTLDVGGAGGSAGISSVGKGGNGGGRKGTAGRGAAGRGG